MSLFRVRAGDVYFFFGGKTLPYRDTIVPELSVSLSYLLRHVKLFITTQKAWDQCLQTFGPGNVLIVSNSAGTRDDAGEIQVRTHFHSHKSPGSSTLLRPNP